VSATLEYRLFEQPFYAGHFNGLYESERAEINVNNILTKEQKYWSEDEGIMQGIFGSAGVDVKGLVDIGGSYQMMFPDSGNVQGYSGKISLGEAIASKIPKLASGEIFWSKEKVGWDRDKKDNKKDAFFDPSIYTYFGYSVGIQMGENMIITIKNINTYIWNEDRELERQPNLVLETAITF